MRRLITLLLCLLSLLAPAFGQVGPSINPGDSGAPRAAQPVPIDTHDWVGILTPQRCPDGSIPPGPNQCGDYRDGYVWGYDGFTGKMVLRPPKILYGPGAFSSDIPMTTNGWTNMFGSVGIYGFRGGLTAYVPRGNFVGGGRIPFTTGSAGASSYAIRVLMGSWLQTSGSQKGILIIPQVATNSTTAAGNPTLHFADTSGIAAGMSVVDMTTPTVIPTGTTVLSTTSTTVTMSKNAAGAGVGSSDNIMFGYVIGYGGPQSWNAGGSLLLTIGYDFNSHPAACNAADKSDQQCEIFVQAYTTDIGAVAVAAPPPFSTPPYGNSFTILRVDGNYGAQ